MKSETRMRAAPSSLTKRCRWLCPPAASRPPSVVRSSRRSGTMQAACGPCRSAIASISSVAAISRLSGSVNAVHQPAHVGVGDVAAILAEMRGDAVGAGPFGQQRRAHRIGLVAAACVPHRGDVVDVDAETKSVAVHAGLSLRRRARRRTPTGEALAAALAVGEKRLVDQQVDQRPNRNSDRHAADRQRLHDRPELVPGLVQEVMLKPRRRRMRLLIEDQTAELIGARPDEGVSQRISERPSRRSRRRSCCRARPRRSRR